MKNGKPTVYIDLDDTAVNYTKQLRKYELMYPEYQYPQSIVGFFLTMEPMPGFLDSWKRLKEYYDLKFLTRPSIYNLNSYTEKAAWVRDHMGGIKALEYLNICPDKSIVGESEDYLIDDWDIHGQNGFRGEFINFGKKEGFMTWEEVTNYLISKND